jgi:hypothetical protein
VICAELAPIAESSASAVITAPTQPADLSECAVVLITGQDFSVLHSFTLPAPTDAMAAWGLGFSLVVTSYLAAWGCGAVLNFIKRN